MPQTGEKCLADAGLFFQSLAEPGPGVFPVPVGHRPGEPQQLARLLDGKPGEKVELSDPRRDRVLVSEAREQFVQRQDKVRILGERTDLIEQFEPHSSATSLQPLPIAGVVDQDPPHRFRRGSEEVPPAVELLVPDQPQVDFMNEGGGAERVARGFGASFAAASFRNSS